MADYRVEDYPEIRDHFFLGGRGVGACRALRGRIALLSVFLHRSESDFPDARKKEYFATARSVCSFFEEQAAGYGASLTMTRYHFDVIVPADANPRDGYALVRGFFGAPTVREASMRYAARLGVDGCVLVLLFDGAGRSFGYRQLSPLDAREEVSVIFYDEKEKPARRVFTLSHEILHQYGAVDYYYPAAVREKAERYFKNSVMGIGDAVVDDLTAYLVGWRDKIAAATYWFLSDTAWMTQKTYAAELEKEWKRAP